MRRIKGIMYYTKALWSLDGHVVMRKFWPMALRSSYQGWTVIGRRSFLSWG